MIFSSCFSNYGFIVKDDDCLFGFGTNIDFTLGVGDNINKKNLTVVPFFSKTSEKIKKICTSFQHTMFLTEKNRLYSCGKNNFGVLCLEKTEINEKWIKVPTLSRFTSKILDVFVGYHCTLILDEDLDIYCCGVNSLGQIGHGETRFIMIPKKINLPEKILHVSCARKETFLITLRGNIFASGQCVRTKLGWGTNRFTKVISYELFEKDIVFIESGDEHKFFLDSEGKVYSMGENYMGMLGLGHNVTRKEPTYVSFLENERIIRVKCGCFSSLFRSKNKIWMSGSIDGTHLIQNQLENFEIPLPLLLSISGKKIIQSLVMKYSIIHFTEKEAIGDEFNNVPDLFCGYNKSQMYEIRVKKHLIRADITIIERFKDLMSEYKKFPKIQLFL